MAKPKARKLRSSFEVQDLWYAGKLVDGEKVCLLLPLKKSRTLKGRFKFVRGVFRASHKTYCECCGPEFLAYLYKADGTKLCLAGGWRGGSDVF